MKFCISPIAPMLALISLEAAIVAGVLLWLVLSWLNIITGPMPEIILGAIVATGVIMVLLPLARIAAQRESALFCNEEA